MIFEDRRDAGMQLAEGLLKYKDQRAVVVALPRGGVPVGFEIAKRLRVPLSVLPVRKIGSPFNSEYAVGAIASGGVMHLLEGIPRKEIAAIIAQEKEELKRREKVYGSLTLLSGKIVILTDDGLATGLTAKAAVTVIKKQKPQKIILAVPGCPLEVEEEFENLVDEFISLEKQKDFTAVGAMYRNFNQLDDKDVMELLKR
jgi:putative phosphoribosyl transferase